MASRLYRDRDYVFGEAILALRVKIGLTQARLANILGVSRRTVVGWEAGNSYPKTEHLKKLIGFAITQHAFPAGKEADKIREFWQIAHQKVLIDEDWLTELLLNAIPPQAEQTGESPTRALQPTPGSALERPRVDWGDALAVSLFYGREQELNLLTEWVVEERCRVVSIVGLGGIGKSALSVNLMHQVASNFEVVIWRSLRDRPPCELLLADLVQALVPQATEKLTDSLERQQKIILEGLRRNRVLLVLDNTESVLEHGKSAGRFLPEYESFGRFLRLSAETEHQSCVLLTSRENPIDLISMEGKRAPVRTLHLSQLDVEACKKLLAEKDARGSTGTQLRLIDVYAGNPLELKIVAQTIADLFGGEIALFLDQGDIIFGNIRALLAEQFARLSALEQSVLVWLAIMREPSSLDELLSVIVTPVSRADLLEAIQSLHRRSLIEQGQLGGSFTLQSVVLEYGTSGLIARARDEIEQGKFRRLLEHGLVLAHTREYLRQTQERLIAGPILAALDSTYLDRAEVEKHLLALLSQFTSLADHVQGYGPANLTTLLRISRGDLRGLDLSRLTLREVYLQGVQMQNTNLQDSRIQSSVFTESFDSMWDVAISPNGEYWAAVSRRGEIRVWASAGQTLLSMWRAHGAYGGTLSFSPDSRTLASGSTDSTVKLWDVTSGALLWSNRHTGVVNRLWFAPTGDLLASAGSDSCIRLWEPSTGTELQIVPHPAPISVLTWDSDGHLLATGDAEGTIRLWKMSTSTRPLSCVQTVAGHTGWIDGLTFSPDGKLLASAGWDGNIKLWDIETGKLVKTLDKHTGKVTRVIWSPDGYTLASCGADQTIRLWDVDGGSFRAVLHGHSSGVDGLAFTPESRSLLSCSEDGTIRLWDAANGQCLRIIHGNVASLRDVAWSPDGTQLISGGLDAQVILFDTTGVMPPRTLHEHGKMVRGVVWSPDGHRIATGGWDNMIRLWEPISGDCIQVLQYPDDLDNWFFHLAWSPDGARLASGTYRHGIKIFDLTERRHVWNEDPLPLWICGVGWSPDGTRLAGGGRAITNALVYVWDAATGKVLQQLEGHSYVIICVAWSPDGIRLASGGGGKEGGEPFVWDPNRGRQILSLVGQPAVIYGVAWGLSDQTVITGSGDGKLRWWDVQSGECLMVRDAHEGAVQSVRRSPDGTKLASCGDDGAIMLWDIFNGEHLQTLRRDRPYERLNITGVKGLTEAQLATLRALGAIEKVENANS